MRGEAIWVRPAGRKPDFIGNLTSLVYAFTPRQSSRTCRDTPPAPQGDGAIAIVGADAPRR